MTGFIVQLFAAGMTFSSMWLMGDRTLWGPTLSFFGGLAFLYINWYVNLMGILVMAVILLVIDIRNFIKWHREGIGWRKK